MACGLDRARRCPALTRLALLGTRGPLRGGLRGCGVAEGAPFLDHRPELRCPRARLPLVSDAHALYRPALEMRVTPVQASAAHEPEVHAGLAVANECGEVAGLGRREGDAVLDALATASPA